MAVTVSHAMRRFPPTSDPPYHYIKSPDYPYSSIRAKVSNENGGLAQSMRYADTWLYGVPQNNASTPVAIYPYTTQPTTPVVLLCSCPGTKRTSKKSSSVCKKCKGTKLPNGNTDKQQQSFGTVRTTSYYNGTVRSLAQAFSSSIPNQSTKLKTKYGTTRSYKPTRENATNDFGTSKRNPKSRPSIFDLDDVASSDPYDMMRRSRLVSPSETRVRTKSISPNRNRARNRRSPSPVKYRSRSANRSEREWVNDEASVVTRKSILECPVNPYELMGKGSSRDDLIINEHDLQSNLIKSQKEMIDSLYEDIEIENEKSFLKEKPASFESFKKSNPNEVFYIKSTNDIRNGSFDKTIHIPKLPERPPRNKSKSSDEETEPKPKITFNLTELASSSNPMKSILKKTSTFNEIDSSIDRMPSPITIPQISTSTGSSQFYLPTPIQSETSQPRKKVQFLVENIEAMCKIEEIGEIQDEDKNVADNKITLSDSDVCNSEEDANDIELITGNTGLHVECDSIIISGDEHREVTDDGIEDKSTDVEIVTDSQTKLKDTNSEGAPKLRRSLSDRANNNGNQSSASSLFNDTMALRAKITRRDHRDVFNALQRLDGVPVPKQQALNENVSQRPKEPPPPPPAPVAPARRKHSDEGKRKTKTDETVTTIEVNTVKQEDKREINEVSCVENEDCIDRRILVNYEDMKNNDVKNNNSQTIVISSEESSLSTEDNVSITGEDSFHKTNISTDYDISTSPKLSQWINKDETASIHSNSSSVSLNFTDTNVVYNYQDISPVKNVILISNPVKNLSNVTSVKLNHTSLDNEVSKTSTENSPTVHKLKIKNEMCDYNNQLFIENSQRKTSIMINGDDCYSTINVSDTFPLYQSSVVVNDPNEDKSNKKRFSLGSTVYINCDSGKYNNSSDLSTSDGSLSYEDVYTKNASLTPEEFAKILKDPVEAVKRDLVPHVCGKSNAIRGIKRDEIALKKDLHNDRNNYKLKRNHLGSILNERTQSELGTSVIAKLLKDPELGSLVEGLENKIVAKLLQESLVKLKNNNYTLKIEEKDSLCSDGESNVNSLNSGPYEQIDNIEDQDYSGSNRSSLTEDDLGSTSTQSKFYQLLANATLENDEHTYESIRVNQDPIYEEIEIPPPLPANPPPDTLPDNDLDKNYTTRSIFEGASKYDILSYLVDARDRGIESYAYSFANSGSVVIECENEIETNDDKNAKPTIEVERTDSGVGSESSKTSRSRYQQNGEAENVNPCEDCNNPVDRQVTTGDVVYTPLVCRKCFKRRAERKEIIMEIVETEEKYARDLQIVLEEFYQPMLVAGLLNIEQLTAVFLNVEELLENSQTFGERLRESLEISIEQGDEDLLTIDVGRLFIDSASMLPAFENYCVRQAAAGLLLANLEKEKELLRIFLKVSQMENVVLRRMNLNSFLMVPVQRVTKYPLLLARLNKVTPSHLEEMKELLTEAQRLVEQHLGQMNASAKDVPSRLWRRLSSGRRTTSDLDSINIKLRKLAVDILEWNHDEAKFALEGKLLYTQPVDSAWKRGRTIKLTPVCALLVTLGRPGVGYKSPDEDTLLAFPRQTGIREAALIIAREKSGRYSLLREPLYLDRCVIATDPAWQSYFEVQELTTKDTFIFKAVDDSKTITWYRNLQYHAQGMGTWRKRRNALANIMITGMSGRS